ncbi:hypothetical protein TWF481_000106 [Arthrobotrys musiformis]|uniref:Uncharacterized protein n=1 Tax=Arthrobotrys musiformis TaxID=47236 RepID=A0AAV9WLL9_9PEZI
MDKWDYPGILSKQKSRIPKVTSSGSIGNDEAEASGSTPAGETSASGSIQPPSEPSAAGPSSTTPAAESNQPPKESNVKVASLSPRSFRSISTLNLEDPPSEHTSPPRETRRSPTRRESIERLSRPRSKAISPHTRPSSTNAPPSHLKAKLKDVQKAFPEGSIDPETWDDGCPIFQEEEKKPKGRVRFGSVDVKEIKGPGGPYGTKRPKRKERKPTPGEEEARRPRGDNTEKVKEQKRPASASGARGSTMGRKAGSRASSAGPSSRGRQMRDKEDEEISSMDLMEPIPQGVKRVEFTPSAKRYSAFYKWKSRREGKMAPVHPDAPPRPLTRREARKEELWRTPQEAKDKRDAETAASLQRLRLRDLSRERAVETAAEHEEGERGRATGFEAGGSRTGQLRRRSRSVDSRSISPRTVVPNTGGIQERDSMDPDPGDPGGGGSGSTQGQPGRGPPERPPQRPQGQPQGQPQGHPEGQPEGGDKPSWHPYDDEKAEKPEDKPPKKPSFIDRFLEKHRVRALPPNDGKLTKVAEKYSMTKQREIEAMTGQQRRRRKLLQIKRRLNQYGMLATVVTSIYLICFGVAWQEHHRWNNHDKEKRPLETSPFAMWCVCVVWICMATLLNMLAIRTIFKLWMFGRKYKNWGLSEWRWQYFSKSGLAICFIIGGVTIAAFGGTVTMLREARMLEIEGGIGFILTRGTSDLVVNTFTIGAKLNLGFLYHYTRSFFYGGSRDKGCRAGFCTVIALSV